VTGQRFVVASAVIGLVVLTVALFLSSLASVSPVRIDGFQRTGDPRKIIVSVMIGLGADVAERSVHEDAKTVAVTVNVRQSPGTYPAIGIFVPVLLSLKDPLAGRVVLDHDGRVVRDLGSYVAPGSTTTPRTSLGARDDAEPLTGCS
jgi:hypothetical protein